MKVVWWPAYGYKQWSIQWGNGYFQLDLGRLQLRLGDVDGGVGEGYHFWYFAPWRWSWLRKVIFPINSSKKRGFYGL